MKRNIIIILLTLGLGSFCSTLWGLSLVIDYPNDPINVIPESGIGLEVYATPTNPGDCLTFSWSDNNGFYSNGTTTGTTNDLTYSPRGNLYGTASITMTATVTDTTTNEPPVSQTFTLIAPLITGASPIYGLSYYGTATYEVSDAGGPETFLNLQILPTPSSTGISYSWGFSGASALTQSGSGGDSVLLQSVGHSSEPGDQDVQLLGPDKSEVADQGLTVIQPASINAGGPNDDDNTSLSLLGYEGFTTTYDVTVLTSWELPVFTGTPFYESFDEPGTSDYAGSNWVYWQGLSSWANWTTDVKGIIWGGLFGNIEGDTYGFCNVAASPQPVYPGSAGDGTLVMNITQNYLVGAGPTDVPSGLVINSHTVDYYRGKGRQ